jgi:hypothetical protein
MTYFALDEVTDAPDGSLEADETSHHLVCYQNTSTHGGIICRAEDHLLTAVVPAFLAGVHMVVIRGAVSSEMQQKSPCYDALRRCEFVFRSCTVQMSSTRHAGGAVSPRSLMSASRFPLAVVASLEACVYAAALGVLLPALPQHRPACIALAVLGAIALPLHTWCAHQHSN